MDQWGAIGMEGIPQLLKYGNRQDQANFDGSNYGSYKTDITTPQQVLSAW